jgi:hypothetical protein
MELYIGKFKNRYKDPIPKIGELSPSEMLFCEFWPNGAS